MLLSRWWLETGILLSPRNSLTANHRRENVQISINHIFKMWERPIVMRAAHSAAVLSSWEVAVRVAGMIISTSVALPFLKHLLVCLFLCSVPCLLRPPLLPLSLNPSAEVLLLLTGWLWGSPIISGGYIKSFSGHIQPVGPMFYTPV